MFTHTENVYLKSSPIVLNGVGGLADNGEWAYSVLVWKEDGEVFVSQDFGTECVSFTNNPLHQ